MVLVSDSSLSEINGCPPLSATFLSFLCLVLGSQLRSASSISRMTAKDYVSLKLESVLNDENHEPSSHSRSFSSSPVPNSPSTSISSPRWTLSITSLSNPIFASAFLLKFKTSCLRAIIWIALDPISREMIMKKVAGFQCFCLSDFARTLFALDSLKALGMIDCHIDGCATRGAVAWMLEYLLPALVNDLFNRKPVS